MFSFPCPAEEGEWQSSLVGTWYPGKVNSPHLHTLLLKKD